MKKLIAVILILTIVLSMAGCASSEPDIDVVSEAEPLVEAEQLDFSFYEGSWATEDTNAVNGGTICDIQVINDVMEVKITQISGFPASRIAEVTHVINQSDIKNSSVEFMYDNDNWDNSGTVVLTFHSDSIDFEVKDQELSDFRMWALGTGVNVYNLKRNNSINEMMSAGYEELYSE